VQPGHQDRNECHKSDSDTCGRLTGAGDSGKNGTERGTPWEVLPAWRGGQGAGIRAPARARVGSRGGVARVCAWGAGWVPAPWPPRVLPGGRRRESRRGSPRLYNRREARRSRRAHPPAASRCAVLRSARRAARAPRPEPPQQPPGPEGTMGSPRCVPLLLLLLLPPLLLTPPAGDAAVITGVSGPAHLSARSDAHPGFAPGGLGSGRWRGCRGQGRAIPGADTCPSRPLRTWESALIQKQRADRNAGRALELKMARVTFSHLLLPSPARPSQVWSVFIFS
jgi:hypothetical protein